MYIYLYLFTQVFPNSKYNSFAVQIPKLSFVNRSHENMPSTLCWCAMLRVSWQRILFCSRQASVHELSSVVSETKYVSVWCSLKSFQSSISDRLSFPFYLPTFCSTDNTPETCSGSLSDTIEVVFSHVSNFLNPRQTESRPSNVPTLM